MQIIYFGGVMEQEPVSETIGTTTNGAISSAISKEYMGKIQYKVDYDQT